MANEIKIISIIENKDGSANIEVEVTPECKERIKSLLGVKRLTRKKFEEFALQALQNYASR
jgi:glutathione synthase/RimK-type ligase-like ATP-grasp enzyme